MSVTLNADLEAELLAVGKHLVHVYEIAPPFVSVAGIEAVNVLNDGGFEAWDSATVLTDYGKIETGGTIHREDASHHGGTYCVRIDKTSAAQATFYTDNATQYQLEPNKYYRITGFVKCSTASPTGPSWLRLQRTTGTDEYLQDDGTWSTSSNSIDLPTDDEWVWFSLWFLVDATFDAADDYKIRFGNADDASASFYFDDFDIEGPYDEPALHYSSQDITWNGTAYTKLAVAASAVSEELSSRAPQASVTFSNVNHALRSKLLPTDTLTGSRLVVRLLAVNSSGTVLPGSLVKHVGTIQQPRRVDQEAFEILSYGLIHGVPGTCPGRRVERPCGWIYKDGVECVYVSTTTATNSGTDATALVVASGVNLVDGEEITVGDGAAVAIASGGGTVNITLAAIRTWVATDLVSYENCNRESPNCTKRALTYRYSGFRGIEDNKGALPIALDRMEARSVGRGISPAFMKLMGIDPVGGLQRRMLENAYDDLPQNEDLSDRTHVVPVVYGRRLVAGHVIERLMVAHTEDPGVVLQAVVVIISEGEISEVIDYYTDEGRGAEVIKSVGGVNRKVNGFFYRVGGLGLNASEVEADYDGDATKLRDQNSDWFSGSRDALSRTAYVTYLERVTSFSVNTSEVVVPTFDVKGKTVWRFEDDVIPTHLVSDGPARVWGDNPVWHVVDLLTATRYGLGRHIREKDIDFTVTKPSADVCDVEVTGIAATVVATTDEDVGGVYTVWEVDDTSQFSRGMPIEYSNGSVRGEVMNVWSATKLKLDIDAVGAAPGETITPILPRYTNNLILGSSSTFSSQVYKLLSSCGGYVTYDNGKIQLRIDQTGSSVAHFKDTGYDTGYGIVAGSFTLIGTSNKESNINSVVGKYDHPNSTESEAVASDWDHRRRNLLNSTVLNLPGVNTRNQAQRLVERKLAESRTLGAGAEFVVGPIGNKVQPGNLITITHAIPNWTAEVKRVKSVERYGLGNNEEFMNRIIVVDYDATLYNDDAPPPITSSRPGSETPDITLAVNSQVGKVVLSWTLGNNINEVNSYRIFKSTSSMSDNPAGNGDVVAKGIVQPHFQYFTVDLEVGEILYFQVVGYGGGYLNHFRVKSNEVSALVLGTDPTDTENSDGKNMVYDPDFNSNWEVSPALSSTPIKPTGSAQEPGDDNGYSLPAQAYDSDEGTAAAAGQPGDGDKVLAGEINGEIWTFATTGAAVEGSLQVSHSIVGGLPTDGYQSLWYTVDNGVTWVLMAKSLVEKATFITQILRSDDRDELKFLAKCNGGTTEPNGKIWEITWNEIGADPYGQISDSKLSLQGKTAGPETWAYGRRPFPGRTTDPTYIVPNGAVFRTHLQVSAKNNTPDDDILVQLYDIENDTYYTLLTVVAATVTTSNNSFTNTYTATSEIHGPFMVVVRTRSNEGVECDKIQINQGELIWAFDTHEEEVNVFPDWRNGRRLGYTKGVQAALNKISEVS